MIRIDVSFQNRENRSNKKMGSIRTIVSYKSKNDLKVAVLGEAGVGKTTLVRAFVEDTSKPLGTYRPTLGAEIRRQDVDVFIGKDPTRISLVIWDLSGQPTFRSLVTESLAGSTAAIVCYDIGRYETFQAVASWFDFLWKAEPTTLKKPIILVGNKKDLRRRNLSQITPGQGKDYATTITRYTGVETPFFETAAIEKSNVSAPFKKLAKMLLEK